MNDFCTSGFDHGLLVKINKKFSACKVGMFSSLECIKVNFGLESQCAEKKIKVTLNDG